MGYKMNERIQELAANARGQMAVLTTVDDEQWRQHEEFCDKFAELIVRDCLKQIYYNTLMSHPEHNWSEKEIGFNEGVDAAYKKVKKHFGVEQ